jgi:hypothetical protein
MVDSSARLGRHRWTIERTGAWLGGWRPLRFRHERSSERFYALPMLACSGTCFNARMAAPEDQQPDRSPLLLGPAATRVTKVPAPRPWAGHGVQAAGGCQDP